ncbi:MAG: hypothetical protein JKY02_07475 [Flavobacteriaceae bacterium]|nr:hypothetical protein [Flavobacteriaceae bacterium]
MKALIKKISATILLFVLLFSSMSYIIDKHYCGETLVDVSYFGEADNCGMEGMRINSDAVKIKKKKCCKNETIVIEWSTFDKEKLTTLQSIGLEFVLSYINSIQDIVLETAYYIDFSPPDIEEDIQVLQQVFLI